MLRSEHILKGLGNQYYRATYKSMGFTTEDLKRPLIGIANAWSECVPGHYNLRQVAQRVKDGIYRAGGTPIEFGVTAAATAWVRGHDGMHFIMPSRELIANSIESMAQINLFRTGLRPARLVRQDRSGHADGGGPSGHPVHLPAGRPDGGRR